MKDGLGQRTPTSKLIYKLRLMADAGGVLTRDRLRVVIEAADRLDELDERVAIMMEGSNLDTGGDGHEEH